MDQVLEKSKQYEVLATEHDPVYRDLVIAIEIVKKFITDNGLIIYGGSSIDYALRLHGDKIYPDELLTIPDLDFYSYDNVEHSYQLADILYSRGYKESRAINAQHMETMRVDLVDNHFIADITYRPKEVFNTLPTLNYNGMKIIHPIFQRIDLHSSLAFPYDNVPREVIFERWSKDIKRFNLLDKYYPVKVEGETIAAREMKIPLSARKFVFAGFAAYALIYHEYNNAMKALDVSIDQTIIPAKFEVSDMINFDTLDQKFEIVHFDPEKAAADLELKNIKQFETYIHMIPERIEGRSQFDAIIYSTKNRLVSANSVKIDENTFRIVNIQYLLKHFIAMHFMHKNYPKIANTYLSRYISLLKMIGSYESSLVEKYTGDSLYEKASQSPLFPTINTYGSDNINLSRQIALSRLYHDLDNTPLPITPINYYPDRVLSRGGSHPTFNYEDSPYFRELGREIK